jgi:crotonobetainyl-CoA:carnitine CoA-transferase CaiB-like acyl-CoA transferase
MPGPLEGLKVLEVANWVAGPSACAIMADMGAAVVKIEHRETGDPVRSINVSSRGVVQHTGGINLVFELLNRGKQSVAIDLGHAQGQEIVQKLAAQSDVVVTNLTPHRLERYRLRYEDLSALNSRVIYVALTGYGREGPDRDRSGFDYAAFWARSGIMASLGESGGPPTQQRPGMGDQTTSLALTAAIGMALYERERSGKGQRIDCSLLHSAMWVLGADMMSALKTHQPVERVPRKDVGNPLFNFYETADGRWVQLVMIESERFWDGFCSALDIREFANDPRFDTHVNRIQHSKQLVDIIENQFASYNFEHWAATLDQYGCMWAPVQTLNQVVADPQVRANGYTTTLTHAEEGDFEILTAPIKYDRTPGAPTTVAPELGQDTELILLDLGYTWDDLAILKEQRVII